MIIAVTGANGFIGRALCEELQRHGHDVRALVANPASAAKDVAARSVFSCKLPDGIDQRAFEGVEAVIHAAYSTHAVSQLEAERVNMEGTANLLALTRRQRAHFTFISSISAHSQGPSYYSRSKYLLEQTLNPAVDLVIRPALVMGPSGAGLFGRMIASLRALPVVPVFGGGKQPLYIIEVRDLARAIRIAVERKKAGLLIAAHRDPIQFRNFYRTLGRYVGKKILFVPMPFWPTLPALRLAEKLNIKLPITSENLLGIKALRPQNVRNELAELGVTPHAFHDALNLI